MPHFLIEVPHSEDKIECTRTIQIFLSSGSHFLANAEWGCSDGVHKSWLIVEVNDKSEALQILPPYYRKDATITKIEKHVKGDFAEGYKYHKA